MLNRLLQPIDYLQKLCASVPLCLCAWKKASVPLCLCALLLLTSCATYPTAQLTPEDLSKEEGIPSTYQIGAEDVLEVQVWKNPDLSRVVTVRPDGKISLPLIGDIQAAGLTATQLKEVVTEKLKAYYKEPPEVSVLVQQVNSYAIYILGEVSSPGKYVVKSGTTFLQAITLAGGFTPFASTSNITLLRKGKEGKETAVRINYKDILAGKLEYNILLKPGDTIIVP